MAEAIKNKSLRPVTIENIVGPVSRSIVKLVSRFSRPYQTIKGNWFTGFTANGFAETEDVRAK
jgi:hypothetical protein